MHTSENCLKLLLQANRILSSTLNLEDVLSKIIELAMEIVSAEASSILLLDEETGELGFDVALGEKGEQVKQVQLKISEGIAGWVAEQKKFLIVNDVTKDPRWTSKIDHQFDFITRSVMAVPLIYKTKLLGVIEVINRRDGTDFDEQSLQILEAFASQAAISVETSMLFTNLKTEKEKLESVFLQMSDAAIFIDSSYNIVFANPACKELIGEIKADIFSTFQDFNIIPPDFNTIFKTKNKTVSIELLHKQRQFYLSGKISSIADDKKNIIGYILTFRDVTEEKKEQLLKRNFLSLISHKLKTPLVSIIGYSDLLAKKF
ncbi:MAG: GAF domain-containing protein [Elusimicrobiota bacterium]|nr:GAF domain-containing protein [Elusimicrobiota bacterium]